VVPTDFVPTAEKCAPGWLGDPANDGRPARSRANPPMPARKYFADNLVDYDGLYQARLAINRTNVLSLFSAAGTE
jgi:hypothetical protein